MCNACVSKAYNKRPTNYSIIWWYLRRPIIETKYVSRYLIKIVIYIAAVLPQYESVSLRAVVSATSCGRSTLVKNKKKHPKRGFAEARHCFYQSRSAWSVDQGPNKNYSRAYNFAPTVTQFCDMWEGLSLPHDTKFGNCRCTIVDSRAFPSWSLIHGLCWSGLIKAEPKSFYLA